jgi:RNA polymerase sigma-70 factor (ECF subfamily)
MAQTPLTQPSLLVRLKDLSDEEAWDRFVDVYVPLVYGFARQHGLQEADARDLVQEVLGAVTTAIERLDYDSERGRFRGWLYKVTSNKYRDFIRVRERLCVGNGDSGVLRQMQEVPADCDDLWELEYRQSLFDAACARVGPEFQATTWQAFWQAAVEGRPCPDVAVSLGISVGAVYIAKSRVLARLREEAQQLLDE